MQEKGAGPLLRGQARVFQLNIGLHCNQACSHCHVESSPLRKEAMDRETATRCLDLLRRSSETTGHPSSGSPAPLILDLTGGAPELQPQFR
jgi:MoaA/NifB/PqqE/SkfB family radical SAM enzyme